MLGQFSYRGGKDLDTGQKTVSPLRAFPFSFFFSPLFFFFFFCRAASRAQRTLSFRFRFPGKFSAPILPPLRSAPNRVIKIRPPSFIHRYSSPLLSFVPLRITFPFSPSSLLVSLVRSYFAKNGETRRFRRREWRIFGTKPDREEEYTGQLALFNQRCLIPVF